jgi:hypothetical protein
MINISQLHREIDLAFGAFTAPHAVEAWLEIRSILTKKAAASEYLLSLPPYAEAPKQSFEWPRQESVAGRL